MSEPLRVRSWGLLALGLTLGLALVISAAIASYTLLEVRRNDQTLEVKGFAEKRIESDWAVWRGTITTRGTSLRAAYDKLEKHRRALVSFLDQESVPAEEYELLPVATQVLFKRNAQGNFTNAVDGYSLSQAVRLASGDIERVSRVAKQASVLVKQGIELSSGSPEYLYTKLSELKIAMLSDATADARRRAQVLAEGSGSLLGALRSARQGVFQITPVHSTEVSNYGTNDTTSREKSIKAVVTMRYAIN